MSTTYPYNLTDAEWVAIPYPLGPGVAGCIYTLRAFLAIAIGGGSAPYSLLDQERRGEHTYPEVVTPS